MLSRGASTRVKHRALRVGHVPQVIVEGDKGDLFYIIKEGEAFCLQNTAQVGKGRQAGVCCIFMYILSVIYDPEGTMMVIHFTAKRRGKADRCVLACGAE